ncbi:MAG: response regulator [Lachnospiraceae bacterium]|nr:response regulator [Lachnospiraceae bacterium]
MILNPNLHNTLLTVQYITISLLFIEICIVFSRWKNAIHSYLFLACIASFISNLGYLFEMKAQTEEAYLSALKFSYAGRAWIVFALFLFVAKMCKVKIPRGFIVFMWFVFTGIYLTVFTVEKNGLYYKDYKFVYDQVFPVFTHTNGITHDLLMGLNAVLMIFGMFWIIREFRNEKNRRSRMRMLMLIMAVGVQALSFFLHIAKLFDISKYYDLTMPGTLFGSVFLLIGIIGFDLLGAREIARDFAVDRISEGIIAVDNSGRIQYYNEPAAKIYPQFDVFYALKPGMGGDALPHYTPYDIIALIRDAVKKGETLKVGDRIYTPEENDLLYKGESYGTLYALVDDTEHYRYMEELQVQRDIADNANEAKSRFLANMSHEIRTPINAMLGMDEMILREGRDSTIRNYASDIMSAGKTLLSLINDILDLSKVEEGKMEIIPVHYDLSSLVNDLVNMTRDRAAKKDLGFNVNVDPHIPHILLGDEIRIKQCAMNLLTNAVKYTEKGEVTLDISYEKKDEDHIILSFKVEDTGIGMKEEDMDDLFSPYKRIEEERNRTVEGTGLGMSITRQLLKLMGSRLDVKSEYGRGSVFSFVVDQEVLKWEEMGEYRFSDASEETYEYHELFHAPEARILLVDDTEMNITVMENLLKQTGIKIDAAASGMEGLRLAKENLYDAIFIDHMMPGMDGIETLKRIREEGVSRDVPAVALTANAVSGAREMYLEAGFSDYLSKPVDGKKLERMLIDMLPAEKVLKDYEENNCEDDISGEIPEQLKEIQELDIPSGLKNCGTAEGFISVITVFHQTAAAKAEEIDGLLRAGDLENYTIKVHALKSSARIIGAQELSDLAKSLEDAGKDGDEAFINDNNGRLLDMYRSLDAKLSCLDSEDEDKPPISEAALKEAYQTIFEIAGSMDYGLMEGILKDLRGYSLPEKDREWFARMEAMLMELNWDGIMETVKEGMKS